MIVWNHQHWAQDQALWKGKLTKPIVKQYKVSFCTTCMDRLEDLSKTLPFNLKRETYPNIEFILLDYGSRVERIGKWVRRHLRSYLESGRLTFYRTNEPKYYSMSHSRNVAFTLATGDIVVNIDADNYILQLGATPPVSFATRLNELANQAEGVKAVFAKGKQLLHGRLGFFRKEFIEELGGYDEEIQNYGYEDVDLLRRAWAIGYTLYPFTGIYYGRISTPSELKGRYMPDPQWKKTEKENTRQSCAKLEAGLFKRNTNTVWAYANVTKNFSNEMITIGHKPQEEGIKLI